MKQAKLKEVGGHLSSKRCSSISACLGGLLKIDVPANMTIMMLIALRIIKMVVPNADNLKDPQDRSTCRT